MHEQFLNYLKIVYLLMGVGAALVVYVVYLGEELRVAYRKLANGFLSVVTHFLLVALIVALWLPMAVYLFATRHATRLSWSSRK